MAHVVAGMHEIEQQIGSGGGGVVYLGRHLRLNKLVVLKADKRSLNTKPEVLRREVDMLKGLSHTYIPQVYDFIQEDGIVYTVMDFIDGESLDKILKRGQTPPQSQLIQWACQILEALCYLHSRPPHGILHGDIKPANIMLRPNGDICLIDYNIALALGENGAVKVRYSIGYASPEHYGMDSAAAGSSRLRDGVPAAASLPSRPPGSSGAETGSKAGRSSMMLDVRSDIYSLGATLYHLISGSRPPRNASQASPLGSEVCSPAVSKIIQKAMAMDPQDRYQSAEEMLSAFRMLHKKDPRMVRHKRRMGAAAAVLTFVFLAGGLTAFVGLKQMEERQKALTLAEYSTEELSKGNVTGAVSLALQAIPGGESILEAPVTARAMRALTDALGVYELDDMFQSLDTVSLSSAPFGIAMTPDGTKFAAVCQAGVEIYETESRKRCIVLPVTDSALAEAVFVDDHRLLYAGKDGVALYDTETQKQLWSGREATTLAVSGDRRIAACVNRDEETAVLYDMESGAVLKERSFEGKHMETAFNDIFANPDNRIFALNEDGTMLAVSFSDGALTVFDVDHPEEDLIAYEESAYTEFEGGFSQNLFAFTAGKGDQSLFGLVDCEEGVYVGELESRSEMYMEADVEGIWLSEGNLLACFDPETLEETEMAFTDSLAIRRFSQDGGYILVATDDMGFSFYDSGTRLLSHEILEESCDFIELAGGYAILANRSQPSVRLMRLESHEETKLLSYDARFVHDEARISQDKKTAMLFGYETFRIYDMGGNMLAEGVFPDAETIYDQQFRKEDGGSYLEVIWYDGTVRTYNAADGSLLSETAGEPPDDSLYEEFFTDRYRIASTLHGAPEVYDLESGELEAVLQPEDYLTYVTQTGEYLITEYVSAAGERYGLLLDENFETAAYLPGLCDSSGDMLVFDYGSGNLRQCRLYSLQELVALGESYMENTGRERKE